jgi:hypothetical protein
MSYSNDPAWNEMVRKHSAQVGWLEVTENCTYFVSPAESDKKYRVPYDIRFAVYRVI